MEILLDKHLPKQQRNWRYAGIALLLLLLLIGICNYPRLKNIYFTDGTGEQTNKTKSSQLGIKRDSTLNTPNADVYVKAPTGENETSTDAKKPDVSDKIPTVDRKHQPLLNK
jgi:hypothetical protein